MPTPPMTCSRQWPSPPDPLFRGSPLEERYGDRAGYVAAVQKAAEALLGRGYLLPEDAAAAVAEAENSGVLR